MNKKGNLFSAGLVSLMLLMIGLIVIQFLQTPIDNARVDLDCSNAGSITDGTKLTCLFVDSTIIYFIVVIFSIAGGVILDKFAI